MNSIRIEKKDIYTIEVNDNGDTIEFDLVDIELPFKCDRALSEINRITKAQLVPLVDHLLMSFWKLILRKQASVKRVSISA